MKIAVTSRVVFEVPDGENMERIRLHFLSSHQLVIGKPMVTITGQEYTLLEIDALVVQRLDH
jgi:hypothetical protein